MENKDVSSENSFRVDIMSTDRLLKKKKKKE